MELLSNTIQRKFKEVIDLEDWEISTPNGWQPISKIMQTIPYDLWLIKTDNRYLKCADTHILIDEFGREVFVCDLELGDRVLTIDGIEEITLIANYPEKYPMYDIEINDPDHLYYTNGFISHNTTTVGAYLLYESLFKKNYKFAVLANKGDTAREILDRIKKMFEELPWFLKPGVLEWNKGSIELSNGNKIISTATSSSSIRGQTMNCVGGDSKIIFQDAVGAIYYTEIEKLDIPVGDIHYIHHKQDQQRKFFIIYELINTKTYETFFGYHETDDLKDGFLGAGQEILDQITQYGVNNLIKECLCVFTNWTSCREFFYKISERLPIIVDERHNISFNPRYTRDYEEQDLRIKILSQDRIFRDFEGIMKEWRDDLIKLKFNDSTEIIVTADHELFANNEYIPAGKLDINDSFVSISGENKWLVEKMVIIGPRWVYDPVEVADTHNFFVNDLLSKNCIYLDEFSFVTNDTEFFASTYPVITSGKSTKVIITSTPMGMNLFYKLWNDAVNGRNEFVPRKFLWYEHPDRDEKWKEETINNIGQQRFDQEFNCVIGNTKVTIRDTETNEIREVSIEDLYHFIGIDPTYEILTENGFKAFSGVKRVKTNTLCDICFDTGVTIKSTLDHKFKTASGEFIFAQSLKPGDNVAPRGKVISIDIIENVDEYVYDIVDVLDGHHYLTNGITSHNCIFLGSANTLISTAKLQQLSFREPVAKDYYLNIYFFPEEEHNYVATVDVSEGIGKDYSVICIFDITTKPFNQVAIYRSNIIPPIMLPDIVFKMVKMYNDAYCIVETNGVGKIVADTLYHEFEYDNMLSSKVREGENIVAGFSEAIGLRQTKKTKLTGASALKTLIESETLLIHDFTTVQELSTFIKKAASYQAEDGKYDDTCMALLIFAWFTHQPYFQDITDENMRDLIKSNYLKTEENNHLIFGFYDDGTDDGDIERELSKAPPSFPLNSNNNLLPVTPMGFYS